MNLCIFGGNLSSYVLKETYYAPVPQIEKAPGCLKDMSETLFGQNPARIKQHVGVELCKLQTNDIIVRQLRDQLVNMDFNLGSLNKPKGIEEPQHT